MEENRLFAPIRAILNLLYPPKCVLCRRIIREQDDLLCPDCCRDLKKRKLHRPRQLETGLVCAAPFFYQEPLRGAFLRYKFQGRDHYAPLFGDYVAQAAQEQLEGTFDLVTWAPLSKKRLRNRGYDQAKLLAARVAEAYDLPLMRTVEKVRNTKTQSSLNAKERAINAKGAYGLCPGARVEGKRILLVDDILTTGSTLSACAAVLQEAGAEKISCAVLARHREEL